MRTYTRQFWLLCTSSFLFFSSFTMLIPELPAYLESLGGKEYIGYIIGLFTITAGLSRPFSGKLTDRWGRIPVMVFGVAVCVLCGLLYPLAQTVALLLGLRFVHGFSTGFKPTGTSAYVADLIPFEKRGEAMGLLSLCGSLGTAFGPFIGSQLALWTSLNWVFYSSSLAAALSILILTGMRETLPNPQRFSISMLRLKKSDIVEPRVWAPSVALVLLVFGYGAVLTLTPDMSDQLQMNNRGLYFLFFTLASVSVRFFAGRASDRLGRVAVLRIGAGLMFSSLLLTGLATSVVQFLLGAVFFGLAAGINSPTIMAWTVDLALDHYRGRALATVYIALEIGIGAGAFISGWLYNRAGNSFVSSFLTGAVLAAVAFIFLTVYGRSEKASLLKK